MNCDKKFLGFLRLEIGGYVLSLFHTTGSLVALSFYITYRNLVDVKLWILITVAVFWVFHFIASILLFVGIIKVNSIAGIIQFSLCNTFQRKAALIVPFIVLYTLIFTCIATFVAFCTLEAIASEPKSSKKVTRANDSTLEMKKKMKEFKENFLPKMNLKGVDSLLLIILSSIVTMCCVYILSCVCSLYDSLKGKNREERSIKGTGSAIYGAVKENESDEP
jgi:hypothetical protein